MEEKKLVVCRKHWISFLLPGAYAVLSLFNLRALIALIRNGDKVALLMLIAAALAALYIVIKYKANYIILTPNDVIARRGFILTNTYSIPRPHIRAVKLKYPLLGNIFRYCTIEVICWGSDIPAFSMKSMTKGEKFMKGGK